MEQNIFTCIDCGETKPINKEGGTGYATDKDGNKICYNCCGKRDTFELLQLKPKAKMCLYWNGKEVINWPGTLRIPVKSHDVWVTGYKRKTTHVQFQLGGKKFKGLLYGDNTQILHVRTD